jgi:transposase
MRGTISMTVRSMSDAELRRLEVLRDVDRDRLPVRTAAQLLGRSERTVWRLLKAFRAEGAPGVISKKRGRPSNRKTSEAIRSAALWIMRQSYADFGPTLAAEKLAGDHGFSFSSETLRKWMIADGLWLDRKQRRKQAHQARHRRDCVGELVQIDGCEHWWFEDCGPQCTLLVVHRRRDEPADAAAVCRERVDIQLLPRLRGLIVLLERPIADEDGRPSRPYRAVDLLGILQARDKITAAMRQAGDDFRGFFQAAQLAPLRAPDLGRPWIQKGGTPLVGTHLAPPKRFMTGPRSQNPCNKKVAWGLPALEL